MNVQVAECGHDSGKSYVYKGTACAVVRMCISKRSAVFLGTETRCSGVNTTEQLGNNLVIPYTGYSM